MAKGSARGAVGCHVDVLGCIEWMRFGLLFEFSAIDLLELLLVCDGRMEGCGVRKKGDTETD
jgi:hypothetical protein